MKHVQLKCKSCSGMMSVDRERAVLSCPYCGSRELILESDEVAIEKIKSDAFREVEFGRQKTYKDIELEKLYYQENRQKRMTEESWKAAKKLWLGMIILWAVLLLWSGAFDIYDKVVGNISVPSSSADFVGKSYEVVMMNLEDAGFTNIVKSELKDLTAEDIEKEGMVQEIWIDGDSDFNAGSKFKKDALIRIFYHSFSEQ